MAKSSFPESFCISLWKIIGISNQDFHGLILLENICWSTGCMEVHAGLFFFLAELKRTQLRSEFNL